MRSFPLLLLALFTLFALLGLSGRATASSSVVIVRPPSSCPTLAEAATRLKAELVAAGFDVVVLEAPAGASARTGIERMRRRAPRSFATLMMVRTRRGMAADIWVSDNLHLTTRVRSVAVDSDSIDSPSDLAIHAVELLRASLTELTRDDPAAPDRRPAAVPLDVAEWLDQPSPRPPLSREDPSEAIVFRAPHPRGSEVFPGLTLGPPLPFSRPAWPSAEGSPRPAAPPPAPQIRGGAVDSLKATPSLASWFHTPSLEGGVGWLHGFGGFGSALAPGIRVSYPVPHGFAARASLFATVTTPALEAPAGTAALSQGVATLQVVRAFPLLDGPFALVASGGLGGYLLHVNGRAHPPYLGHSSDTMQGHVDT